MARKIDKTPRAIRQRNHAKRHTKWQVWVSEDLTHIGICAYAKDRPVDRVALERIVGKHNIEEHGGKLYGFVRFPNSTQGHQAGELLKLQEVPARCERCQGVGKIRNPEPAPPGQEVIGYEAVIARMRAPDYKPYEYELVCPACLGSGCAAVLESSAT